MTLIVGACYIQVFKDKAAMIADKLLPAFNTPTGIPLALVNLNRYAMH